MSVHILQFQITIPITNYTLQSPNLGLLKIDKNLPTGFLPTCINNYHNGDNATQMNF